MKIHDESMIDSELMEELKIDCSKCSGLCCVALFCFKMDGFPEEKPVGKPCINLQDDFRCKIHTELIKQKMKGCLGYDCFGAGQKVSQTIYHNTNWQTDHVKSQEIFDVFLVIFQIHQILYFLAEAKTIIPARELWNYIGTLIKKGRDIGKASPQDILAFDIGGYKQQVNECLRKVSSLISVNDMQNKEEHKMNFMGKNFKRKNFDGRDFAMSLFSKRGI